MFDFLSDPGYLIIFGFLMVVAFCNGLFWASGRPHLMRIASPNLLMVFLVVAIWLAVKFGWVAGVVCLPAGLLVAAFVGMPLGKRLPAVPATPKP